MSDIEETKNWFLNKVWPEIVRSGKLGKNSKNKKDFEKSVKLLDVSVVPIGLEEAFMLTLCYRILVEYYCNENDEKQSLHLIAKKTPTTMSAENYDALNFDILFYNEILAYNKIIPKLLKLSNKDENDTSLPTYYYSELSEFGASIVLGDFKQKGFCMSPDRFNLSLEHILLGAEHIGFFHGLCYALKHINRQEFDDVVSLAKESRFVKNPPTQFLDLNRVCLKRFKKATDKYYPEISKDFQDNIMRVLSAQYFYSKKMVKPIEPFATLCHGDYLRNNIAFSYDDLENPTIPRKAMMFDFQTLRYSSPMVDFTTFLTISTGAEVRVPHFDEIFDTYHKNLTSTFEELTKQPIPDFMSRSSMLKEYVRYLLYSLGIASYFLPAMHEPTDIFSEMLSGDDDTEKFEKAFLVLGGDLCDKEIASLHRELYEFCMKENVNVFEE